MLTRFVFLLFVLKGLFLSLCCGRLLVLVIGLELAACRLIFCISIVKGSLRPYVLLGLIIFASESTLSLAILVGVSRSTKKTSII